MKQNATSYMQNTTDTAIERVNHLMKIFEYHVEQDIKNPDAVYEVNSEWLAPIISETDDEVYDINDFETKYQLDPELRK